MNKKIQLLDLGNKDYKETWEYQEELFKKIEDSLVQMMKSKIGNPNKSYGAKSLKTFDFEIICRRRAYSS